MIFKVKSLIFFLVQIQFISWMHKLRLLYIKVWYIKVARLIQIFKKAWFFHQEITLYYTILLFHRQIQLRGGTEG